MEAFNKKITDIKNKLWRGEILDDEAYTLASNIKKDVNDIVLKEGLEIINIDYKNLIQLYQKQNVDKYELFYKEIAFIEVFKNENMFNYVMESFQTYCVYYIDMMNKYCEYDYINIELETFSSNLDIFINYNLFIIEYLTKKNNGEELEIVKLWKKFNEHFILIEKHNIDKIFNNTLLFVKNFKFVANINIIFNDIENMIKQELPRENKWNREYCNQYNAKVSDIAHTIMEKITEMNSKFALTENTYNERLRIFCEELSTKNVLTCMFEHILNDELFDLHTIPFFTDYNFKYSKYLKNNNYCDGTKQEICLNTINIIYQYLSCITDFYTYTVSFNKNDSDFIHIIEDTNIGNDIHIYFSDMFIVDNRNECENKITYGEITKQILENVHLSRFYFIYTGFMTEYLQVKNVSLTLEQSIQHSIENKFSLLLYDDDFKQHDILNNLIIHESYNNQNMFIGNDEYVMRVLHDVICYKNKNKFINKHVITHKRMDDDDFNEYCLTINNINHRLILEQYVMEKHKILYNS